MKMLDYYMVSCDIGYVGSSYAESDRPSFMCVCVWFLRWLLIWVFYKRQ